MDRVNQILVHPLYQECVEKICKLEKDRIFCRQYQKSGSMRPLFFTI